MPGMRLSRPSERGARCTPWPASASRRRTSPRCSEIDAKTLRKHFRRELDRGSIEATAKVAQTLFRMATEGGNVAAAIFWMKARAGWREKHELVLSTRPVQELSDEELAEIVQQGRDRLAIAADTAEPGAPDEP